MAASGFSVKDVMDTNVVSVREETTLEELLLLIRRYRMTEFPVVDRDGRFRGMVYEPDLFRALYPETGEAGMPPEEEMEDAARESRNKAVGEIMSRDALQINADEHILRAGADMLAHRVAHAPVIREGHVIGMITQRTIFSEIMSRAVLAVPEGKLAEKEAAAKPGREKSRDQRLFRRFRLNLIVAYKRTSEKGDESRWRKGSLARTVNMSAGGFLIRVKENLPEKALLDVAFDLFQKDRPIRRICRVIHCRPSPEPDYFDAGIMLLALNPEEQEKIDAFLGHSGRPEPPPS